MVMGSTPSIEKSGVAPGQVAEGEGGNRASSKISQQFKDFGTQVSRMSAHGDVLDSHDPLPTGTLLSNLKDAATIACESNDVVGAERCVAALERLLEVAPDDAFAALLGVAKLFGTNDAMAELVDRVSERLMKLDPSRVFAHLELYHAI